MITPFEGAEMFFALRLHFTRSSYDYYKYGGKTTLTREQFDQRPDRFIFAKLVQKYHAPYAYRNLVIANCLEDPHLHVRALLTPEAHDIVLAYDKVHQSLSYVVEQDSSELLSTHSLEEVLSVKSGYPLLLQRVWQKRIRLETLIVWNRIFDCLSHWNRKITDTMRWPSFYLLCQKYDVFVTLDHHKIKAHIRQNLTTTI